MLFAIVCWLHRNAHRGTNWWKTNSNFVCGNCLHFVVLFWLQAYVLFLSCVIFLIKTATKLADSSATHDSGWQ